ncbi:hypothetical protein ACFPDQ_08085 [Pseudofrancisella aestuarii]|uniref:N-formylglutamate amidohydrolase n=1 Tax=Pseudofrancisella aestuarii TaxID=2670347 RepID=A0ABV9TED8_9GAMM|nr:hypothetical protein [Pseudofrancisella aestuarii]
MNWIDKPSYVKYHESATFYFYSDGDLRFDVLLTCPHSELGHDFIEFDYPIFAELIKLDKVAFEQFLEIECDFGTRELAKEIAKFLYNKFNLKTLIIEPSFPRSILDAGRLYPNCLRNVIDYNQHPKLKAELLKLYDRYMEHLCHAVAIAKSYNAVSIDLHTMSTYSPNIIQERYAEAIIETPDTLEEYIRLFRDSHKEGELRLTELFTGDHRNGIFANQELLDALAKQFHDQGVEIQYDKPYILAEHLVAHYLVCELGTVCIDLPKDFLSKKVTSDTDYDLAKLEIDEVKLNQMTAIFSKAIYDAHMQLKEKRRGEICLQQK